MSARLLTLLMSIGILISGCRREKLSEGFHRAGSSEFTSEEAKAVQIVKAHLEKEEGKRIDARYRVTQVPEGFSVHVSYVAGYQRGQPVFTPGGFCVVIVSKEWKVADIFGGS